MTVSVILASYNGEKYIGEQLGSIVPFLEEGDELIVSDDGSSDGTLDIVRTFQKKYPLIRITEGAHGGSSANFASAVPKCQGSVVLFCDQDDVWMPDKLNRIKQAFREDPKAELVMHNAGFCDSEGNLLEGDIFSRRHPRHGFVRNLMYSAYYGCCMAAKRSFLMGCLPLPDQRVPYDQYFSLIAEHDKAARFLDEKLILHRYHGQNQSQKMSNIDRLRFRLRVWNSVHRKMRRK